jgi:IS30 family transposase
VVNAVINHARKLPRDLYKSLTWDRGSEMAEHHRFSLATDIEVYFCDPQQPSQLGSNESTNGLLRQYLPKGMDLSDVHQSTLNAIARRLNEQPRDTLNFETPAGRCSQCVASIG